MDNEIISMEFENNGKKYVYDFDRLTVEQAELAKESAEFKINQKSMQPSDFNQVLRTHGAEWLSITVSFLLLEVVDGITQPFVYDKAKEVENWIKQLPVKYKADLESVVQDFFQNIGMQYCTFALLPTQRKGSEAEMLMLLAEKILKMKEEEENSLNNSKNESDAI